MEEQIITWGLVKVPSAPYNGPCKEFGFYSEEVRSHWRGLSRDVTRSGFHFDRVPVGIDCGIHVQSGDLRPEGFVRIQARAGVGLVLGVMEAGGRCRACFQGRHNRTRWIEHGT